MYENSNCDMKKVLTRTRFLCYSGLAMEAGLFFHTGKFSALSYMIKNAPRGCTCREKEDVCLRRRAAAQESRKTGFYFMPENVIQNLSGGGKLCALRLLWHARSASSEITT